MEMNGNGNGVAGMKREYPGTGFPAAKKSRFSDANFQPRILCKYFEQGACARGDECTYAHGIEELEPGASGVREGKGGWKGGDGGGKGGDGGFPGGGFAVPMPAVQAAFHPPPEEFYHEGGSSALSGPRQNMRPRPTQICHNWLSHPSRCSDACPLAHGLLELAPGMTASLQMIGNAPPEIVKVDRGKGPGPAGKGGQLPAVVRAARQPLPPQRLPPPPAPMMEAVEPVAFEPAFAEDEAQALEGSDAFFDAGGPQPGGAGGAGNGGGASRFGGGFMPTQICRFFLMGPGLCKRGDACTYAHGEHELKPG